MTCTTSVSPRLGTTTTRRWALGPLAAGLLCASAALANAQEACVELKFFNLTEGTGTLNVAVWGSAETFMKKPVWVKTMAVTATTLSMPMCGVTATEVAVTVFQDLNDNKKFDMNPLGIPAEPYGASGKPPMFSAPTWATTKVPVNALPIEIRL